MIPLSAFRKHNLGSALRQVPSAVVPSAVPCEMETGPGVPSDPDLAKIVEAWPTLPAALRAGGGSLPYDLEHVRDAVDHVVRRELVHRGVQSSKQSVLR